MPKWHGSATVYGDPQAMGSKRAFVVKGRAIVTDEKGKRLKTFQESLREEMRECKPDLPVRGPVAVSIEIVMRRPKSHYGTGRNSATLKPSAPEFCITKPDADKVLRAVLDCGTGIWWRDDSQVCHMVVTKRYAREGEETHTRISAEEI